MLIVYHIELPESLELTEIYWRLSRITIRCKITKWHDFNPLVLIAGVAVARNRPFNSCKIEDNEGLRPFLRPSISLASPPSILPRSFSTPALFLSHSCLPVEPNPAPRSRVQRRSLHRSVINHRRVGLTRLHAREPTRARRELLSSSFFFLSLSFFFTFRYTKAEKGSGWCEKNYEK